MTSAQKNASPKSAAAFATQTSAAVAPAAPAETVSKPVGAKPRSAPKVASPAKAVKTAKPAKAAKVKAVVEKPAKEKKPKLVRDSFTMPKNEYAAIDTLKARTVRLEKPAKKSELLRAGIMALATMDDATLLAALASVPTMKTGRPKKG